jgi:hypothetical protein
MGSLAGALLILVTWTAMGFAYSTVFPEGRSAAYEHGSQELIATDGTYCFVSRGTFDRVEIGHHVQCTWPSEPPRDPHGTR